MKASKIFHLNGSEDPWLHVTMLKTNPNANMISKMIECDWCAHCIDLKAPDARDPKALTDVRA